MNCITLESHVYFTVDVFLSVLDTKGTTLALSPALVERLAANRAFFESRLAEGFRSTA